LLKNAWSAFKRSKFMNFPGKQALRKSCLWCKGSFLCLLLNFCHLLWLFFKNPVSKMCVHTMTARKVNTRHELGKVQNWTTSNPKISQIHVGVNWDDTTVYLTCFWKVFGYNLQLRSKVLDLIYTKQFVLHTCFKLVPLSKITPVSSPSLRWIIKSFVVHTERCQLTEGINSMDIKLSKL